MQNLQVILCAFLFSLLVNIPSVQAQSENQDVAKKEERPAVKLLKKGIKDYLESANETGSLNIVLKNTEVTIGGFTYYVTESTDKLYKSKIWNVNKGTNIIKRIYSNIELQSYAGREFGGNDYSFDFFVLNDTITCFAHLINRKPFNADYSKGIRYQIYKITDSVIYSLSVQGSEAFQDILRKDYKSDGFAPVVQLSNGNIYGISEGDNPTTKPIGSFKHYDPSKLNLIFTTLLYQSSFGKLDEMLFSDKMAGFAKAAENWYNSQKECRNCSKNFTGAAFRVTSKVSCSSDVTNTGINLNPSESIFCTNKCAVDYCHNYLNR